jgi:hypothetical protein
VGCFLSVFLTHVIGLYPTCVYIYTHIYIRVCPLSLHIRSPCLVLSLLFFYTFSFLILYVLSFYWNKRTQHYKLTVTWKILSEYRHRLFQLELTFFGYKQRSPSMYLTRVVFFFSYRSVRLSRHSWMWHEGEGEGEDDAEVECLVTKLDGKFWINIFSTNCFSTKKILRTFFCEMVF